MRINSALLLPLSYLPIKWWRLIGLHYLLAVFSGTWALASPNLRKLIPLMALRGSLNLLPDQCGVSFLIGLLATITLLNECPLKHKASSTYPWVRFVLREMEPCKGHAPFYIVYKTITSLSMFTRRKLVQNKRIELLSRTWQVPILPLN